MTQDRNSTGETKCGGGGGDGKGRMEQKRNMANGKVRRGDEELARSLSERLWTFNEIEEKKRKGEEAAEANM